MSSPTAQLDAPDQLLRIKLAQDAINIEDMLIRFRPENKNEFETDNDAEYLAGDGNGVSIASLPAGSSKLLAINEMHSIDEFTRVRINITAKTLRLWIRLPPRVLNRSIHVMMFTCLIILKMILCFSANPNHTCLMLQPTRLHTALIALSSFFIKKQL